MSDFQINVKAPPVIGALLKADCNYLIDRISHTRFIASSSHGITLEDSRLYEAGKTIAHIVEVLMEGIHFSSVELKIQPDAKRVEGLLTVRDINNDLMLTHQVDIQIVYNAPQSEDAKGKYIVTIMDNCIPIKRTVYEMNEYEVMSYDMNFPAPSVFLSEITDSILSMCSE